jgi:glycosyltransferase involved in cell wall biosynthesis
MSGILVLTYWTTQDALIQTYTLPYVKQISRISGEKIWLVTLEKPALAMSAAQQTDSDQKLSEFNITPFRLRYRPFGILACLHWLIDLFKLCLLVRREKISTIHAWCTPAGALGYILSMLTGARLILDSFEPHAEAMVENGTWSKNSLAYRLLWNLEGRQARRASAIIAAASGMDKYAAEKYKLPFREYFVKPACVDLDLFSSDKKKNPGLLKELGLEGKIVCTYAGKFGGIYLREEVFLFFSLAYARMKDALRILILTSHPESEILELAAGFNIPASAFVIRFIPHAQVPVYIGLADFAISPIKSLPTKKYCSPIKTGEYWAMGLPVLITPGISQDSETIERNKIGYVWADYSKAEFENSLDYVEKYLSEDSGQLSIKIRHIAETQRNFNQAKMIYKTIYTGDSA